MDYKLALVSLALGGAIGSTGTYVAIAPAASVSGAEQRAISAPIMALPTAEEAAKAIDMFNKHDPLRYGDPKPVTVSLGQCGPNPAGAGVSCMTTIHDPDKTRAFDKEVGYAQSSTGEWIVNRY